MKLKLAALVISLAVIGGGFYFATKNKDDNDGGAKSSQSSAAGTSEQTKKISADGPKLAAQTVGGPTDCSLYSFEELSKVWGVPFTDTDEGKKVSQLTAEGGKLYECGYHETDSGMGVSYVIQYKEYPTVEKAKSEMTSVRQGAKIGDKVYFNQEEKSGVGDEAFFSRATGTGPLANNQQIYIRNGNVVFLLSGVNLDGIDESYKDKLVASYKLHFN